MYVFRLVALVYLSSHAAAHVLLHDSNPNPNPNPNPIPNPTPNQVLLLRPGRVLRSFLRREASPYVGAQQQLAVPTLKS